MRDANHLMTRIFLIGLGLVAMYIEHIPLCIGIATWLIIAEISYHRHKKAYADAVKRHSKRS